MENFTTHTLRVGPVGPTNKENQVKMYKKYHLRYLYNLFETVRLRIHIKQLDPYQIEKQDPNPYQSKRQDPDPYQKGLDSPHWSNKAVLGGGGGKGRHHPCLILFLPAVKRKACIASRVQ